MSNRKLKKPNMQQEDAKDYEADAKAYFESIREAFEQTLRAIKKDRPRVVERMARSIGLLGICSLPFAWTRLTMFVFRQNSYTFFGKPQTITDTAVGVCITCIFAMLIVGGAVRETVEDLERKASVRLLSKEAMVFALSCAITRELENFERSNLPHHRQTILQLWAKLLTYLRWTLKGVITDKAYFHMLPPSDFSLAPFAEHLAKALNWSETSKNEYKVVVALNSLHSKVSPRLRNDFDNRELPHMKRIFRGIGNFFYTSILRSSLDWLDRLDDDDELASWGYGELLRAAEIVNGFSVIKEPEKAPRTSFLSSKVFMHNNVAVAFLAWWLVFQALFVLLLAASFRLFPTLTMNSQAMVGLIAAPIAAAISMVGISRKGS